jgi:PPOX class probable F420-dependent enzyme
MVLPDAAKALIAGGALGHLVTLGRDGAPHVTAVWVAVEGDDLLTAHLNPAVRKLENVRRDPRVAVSFEGTEIRPPGLREYLVVTGRGTIEEGGAAALLQELAHVHLGPDVRFPPMDDPPPGVRLRIVPERVGGIGPWTREHP